MMFLVTVFVARNKVKHAGIKSHHDLSNTTAHLGIDFMYMMV